MTDIIDSYANDSEASLDGQRGKYSNAAPNEDKKAFDEVKNTQSYINIKSRLVKGCKEPGQDRLKSIANSEKA